MILSKIIQMVDDIKPNAFTPDTKTAWINEVEGYVQTEVMLINDIVRYDYDSDQNTELLVAAPHDKLYWTYLTAMIDFANGEYSKYANTMEMYEAFMGEYMRWYAQKFRPADGQAESWGYYISAYGIAQKHGYGGSEEEWLESIRGARGDRAELRYNEDTDALEWKFMEESEWQQLITLAQIQGEAIAQTLAQATEAKEAAADSAEAAMQSETNAGASETAAKDAAASASANALAAGNSAGAAAGSASSAGASAQSAASSANAAAGSAQNASTSETNAKASETAAGNSAAGAKASEDGAKAAQSAAEKARDEAQQIVGGDNMAAAVYDPQGKKQDIFKYTDDKIAEIPEPVAENVSFSDGESLQTKFDNGDLGGETTVSVMEVDDEGTASIASRLAEGELPDGYALLQDLRTHNADEGAHGGIAALVAGLSQRLTELESKPGSADFTVEVPVAWAEDATNGGYTQTVAVSGILATDNPIADVVLGSDVEANALYLAAWALVTRITTADGSITLYANGEAPETAFTIRLKAVR